MNQDETIALFQQGKEAWNAWAQSMLAEREAIEADGRWAATRPDDVGLVAENEATRDWMDRASADFSALHFMTRAFADAEEAKGGEEDQPDATQAGSVVFGHEVIDLCGYVFPSEASFKNARFSGSAWFTNSSFSGPTSFDGASVAGDAQFGNAIFLQKASFALVKFDRSASFNAARFHGSASFTAIRGERGFSMADAHFDHVPDFIQAHFEEAPRLDNVRVNGRRLESLAGDESEKPHLRVRLHRELQYRSYRYRRITMAERDIPARWRALKRLAVQAHDQDREHEFFAREIRSARFATDWPVPFLGFFRFIFGYCYLWFSNYGRSVVIPFAWWIAAIGIGAMAYLGEHRSWIGDIDATHYESVFAPFHPIVRFYDDWRADRPCFTPPAYQGPGNVGISGLSDQLRAKTSAPNEALHLAFRNAFLVLDGGEEAAHRIYGCLYGLELYNQGDPVPIVPPGVSVASAVQKIFSAVMIFLFGLALRNMLKMK